MSKTVDPTIKTIDIQNLRGIRRGKLDGLTPVTVLVGANGSGKSTVLEAIGISVAEDAERAFNVLGTREWLGLRALSTWFSSPDGATIKTGTDSATETTTVRTTHLTEIDLQLLANKGQTSDHQVIALSRQAEGGGIGSWRALIDEDGSVSLNFIQSQPTGGNSKAYSKTSAQSERSAGARHRLDEQVFVSSDRNALDAAKRSGTYDALEGYLRVLKPRLKNIESLGIGTRSEPHVFERDPHAVYPLAYAGEGFRKALAIAAVLGAARGGICTIDEPEAHGHPSLFRGMVAMVRAAVADGTQIFFSTHSLDFIRVLAMAFENSPGLWSVVALRLENGELLTQSIHGDRAIERLLVLGDDVRL